MSPPLCPTLSPALPSDCFASIFRDMPYAQARASQSAKPQFKGVAEAALYCARPSHPPTHWHAETYH